MLANSGQNGAVSRPCQTEAEDGRGTRMSFRQLLEKYQQNTATAAEREQVEAELEKYAALTEYLLEEEFQPKMEEDTAAEQEELQKSNLSLKCRTRWILL